MKIWLYGLLSVLLLFTAAIVSNIEAVQQTLNVTLDTTQATQPQTPALVITPELLDTLCGLLQTTSVQEEQATPLLLTQGQAREEEGENNGERVQAYLAEHPKATLREIAEVLTISVTTARKWRSRVQGEGARASATK